LLQKAGTYTVTVTEFTNETIEGTTSITVTSDKKIDM
jgi:hypothetical protein